MANSAHEIIYTGEQLDAQLAKIDDKADRIPEVSHGTADTTYELTPNVMHIWGVVESLTLTLSADTDSLLDEFMFTFTSGDTPTVLSLPASVRWVSVPQIEANKTYQVSIVNNLAGYLTSGMTSGGGSGDADLTGYATQDWVQSQGFLTEHQSLSDYLTAAAAAETYQPKGNYLTEHQDISGKYEKPASGIPKSDLASDVQTSLGKADTALQGFTETDPTVPSWAKQATKPTYTAGEVGALPDTTAIPQNLSDLSDDAAHRLVTDAEKQAWNTKELPEVSASDNGKILMVVDGAWSARQISMQQYYTGTAEPDGTLGNDGDLYLQTS